jgi:hypothetical protein
VNSVYCFDDFELDSGAFPLRHGGESVRIDATVLLVLHVWCVVRASPSLKSK